MSVLFSSRHSYFKTHLILIVLCLLIQSGNSTSKKNKDVLVVDSNPNVQQRISILVGTGKAGEEDGSEDGDNLDEDSNNEPASVNGDVDICSSERCCFQFTWTGFQEESQIPTVAENRTCEYLKKHNKDPDSACFDPIIYTSRTAESQGDAGTRPDMDALYDLAIENKWPVFCPLTKDKSCMTYSFYSRTGRKEITNMTRFCGSVTDIASGNRIDSGCFTEKVQGYIKEVCVCTGSLCNSGPKRFPSTILLLLLLCSSLILWNKS